MMAFSVLKAQKVDIFMGNENQASVAVPISLNFTLETVRKGWCLEKMESLQIFMVTRIFLWRNCLIGT